MKKYLVLGAFVLSMCASFASRAADEHLKGYIDDSMCASNKTPPCTPETRVKCAIKCIKSGAAAVFVVGDKVYKVANQKAVLKYAGKNVTIDGKITDDTIEVTKVTEEKS